MPGIRAPVPDSEYDALRRAYGSSLGEKVPPISESVARLESEGWRRSEAERLYDLVHRLAVRSSLYEFAEVAEAARVAEDVLLRALTDPDDATAAACIPHVVTALPALRAAAARATRWATRRHERGEAGEGPQPDAGDKT